MATSSEQPPNYDVIIRPCQEDDASAVIALLGQIWPGRQLEPHKMKEVFCPGLASDSQHFICASEGDRVVGFCSFSARNSMWQQGDLGHIDELIVDSGYRRRGIGGRLVQSVIAYARQRGVLRVELDSAFQRLESHKFYQGLGFEKRAFLFSLQIGSNNHANQEERNA